MHERFLTTALLLCLLLTGCLSPHIGPPPEPVPPNPPTPVVEPGPIRVLVIEETEDRGKPDMRPYLSVWNSTAIQGYLNSHCAKDGDGRPAWRWLDDDTDMSSAGAEWQEAMRQPRDSLPWIVISNGKAGTAGPLPASEDGVLKLLRKWGGE